VNAVGFTLPSITMRNCLANDAVLTSTSSASPVPSLDTTQHHDHKKFTVQQLQVYCDLDVISYKNSSSTLDAEFRARWPKEVHALIFKPIDIQAGVAVRQYEQRTVATSTATDVQYSIDAVSCDCGHIQAVVDSLQVAELSRIVETITTVRRRIRYRQYIPRGSIENRLLPPVVIMPHAHSKDGSGDVNGRILPHLQWQKSRYETAQNAYTVISAELGSSSTSSTRARSMWKYAITCVMQSVSRSRADWCQRMHNGQNSNNNLDTMIQYIHLYGRTLVVKHARMQQHSDSVNISKLHSSTPHLEKQTKVEQLWLADTELTLEQDQVLFLRVCAQVAAHITVTSVRTASTSRTVVAPQWPPLRDNLVKLIRSMIVLRAGVVDTKARAKAALDNSSNDDNNGKSVSDNAAVNSNMDAVVLEYFSRDGQRLDGISGKHNSKVKTFSDSDTDDSDDDSDDSDINSDSDSDFDGAINIVNSKQQVLVNGSGNNNNTTSSSSTNGSNSDTAALGMTADIGSMSAVQIADAHAQAVSANINTTVTATETSTPSSLPASTLLDTPGQNKFNSMLNQDMSSGGGRPLVAMANTATAAQGSMSNKSLLKQLLHLP
jgi:hypothetical protein